MRWGPRGGARTETPASGQLVERAPAPDDEARSAATPAAVGSFDDVYRVHVRFVWRTLARLGIAAADIEDVAHETFMVVHRRLPEFDGRGSVRAWLFGIARGIARNRHRSRDRTEERLRMLPRPISAPSLDDVMDARQAADAVQQFLDRLEPRHRLVFELSEIEGFRAPEIALALQENLNTVNTRLRRARIAFARWVEDLAERRDDRRGDRRGDRR